jgi:hypothetical protein
MAFCQTFDLPVIRVASDEVQVPVYVFDRKIMASVSQYTGRPPDFGNDEVLGLTAKDFHLFEDGKEQAIRSVRWVQDFDAVNVRDNLNNHNEISFDTPRGKWITRNTFRPLPVPTDWPPWLVNYDHFYVLGYSPSQSALGSCHRVEVRVDRADWLACSRSEYCNVKHSSSDPLNGTKLSQRLEGYAALDQVGKIRMSMQANAFYREAGPPLVDIAVEFPSDSLRWRVTRRPHENDRTSTSIAILGLLYERKSRSLAARFSSLGPCSGDVPCFWRGWQGLDADDINWAAGFTIPTGYETQVGLRPGQYNLVVVLSDGSKFGRVERPVIVDPYDGSRLAISSVMLSKRYRDAAVAAKEEEETHFVPEYIPLVSNGVQFAPAGDTRFKKDAPQNEPLFAYFEVYEPLLASTPSTTVQTRMRITDLKNGKPKVDTGLRSAADWIKPGSSVIHIAEKVDIRKLPSGSYELEVQATDSAGRSTAWRSATFTVEGSKAFGLN